MDNLLIDLPELYSNDVTLWLYNEKIIIYNKFNQFIKSEEIKEIDIKSIKPKEIKEIDIKPIKLEEIKEIDIKSIKPKEIKEIDIKPIKLEEIKEIDIKPIKLEEIKEIDIKPIKLQQEIKEIDIKPIKLKEIKEIDIKSEIKKEKKNKKITPLEVILEYTKTNIIMKEQVKLKLIETLSNPNYNKLFGLKKTSEIMTALTKNTWNQSIVIFISFILDMNINYKEKDYIYNKDKNNGTIIVKS